MAALIGICAGIDYGENNIFSRRSYVQAVERAGGLPLIIPPLKEKKSAEKLIETLDALIFAGGGDIAPIYFKEEPHIALGNVEPERDRFEIALAALAWERNLPALGICRGMQLINIALGGDIWQDLEMRGGALLQHNQKAPPWHGSHRVEITKALSKLGGPRLWPVNSLHHQGIRKVADNLKIEAKAADGVIEAISARDKGFFIGVQWHPEWLGDAPWGDGLFKALVLAAH